MNFAELLSTEQPKSSRKKSESQFWTTLKEATSKQLPQYKLTRLESWATLGVPDLLVCDDEGVFHLIELKSITGKAAKLSPHQISFFSRHSNASVWVLIYRSGGAIAPQVYLFHGSKVLELAKKGLRAEPCGVWDEKGMDWGEVWERIKSRPAEAGHALDH